ncbi:MAG: (Fe-S)-binding protein [Myxococcota bacterium]|jgi:Fe-S oxidoreductase|nr:(Fe-S)-binding protein [Myxococcota bacterium]
MAETTAPLQLDPAILEGTLDCVHCGLCLSACPTYRITGRENSSPRGRIYLLRGAAAGEIEFGSLVADELSLCLGCRACETQCPAGVEYGALLEEGRAAAARSGLRKGWGPRLEGYVLRHLLVYPRRLHASFSLLRFLQKLRLDRLGALLLPFLKRGQSLLPPVPAASARQRLPALTPAEGERRGRVALLEGCVMAELFGEINRATVRVLAQNGYDVVVPQEQGCCGALHAHSGDMDSARKLADRNIAAFSADEYGPLDAVVSNSAGCGAALREVDRWLPGRGDLLSSQARDVCEWLDEVGLRPPRGKLPGRVCYDDPCHLVHAQGVRAAPRRLLNAIEDLELVPHADAESCCGAAGTYSLLNPAMAAEVLRPKLDALEAVAPDWIVTGNPGCLLQLRSGARERGLAAQVVHPVELLDRAYRG